MYDLYILNSCPYCQKVMEFLNKKNIKYHKFDTSNKDNVLRLMTIGGIDQVPFLYNDETDEKISSLETPTTEAKTTVDDTVEKINNCADDRIRSTHNLETSIDISDYKLNALYNVTVTPENIISALEQILV